MTRVHARPETVSVLDIGSTKISCIIARLVPCDDMDVLHGRTHRIEVVGIGHQKSRGIKSGVVVNLDEAEQAIRLAVDTAERMAGLTVESVIINLSAGRLKSTTVQAAINLNGQTVTEADVRRVVSAGMQRCEAHERQIVHAFPTAFSLDSESGIADPAGLSGDQLGVSIHLMTADSGPLRNLELCVNRAHLAIAGLVATPFASGLSALVSDEAQLGAACIDFGGGTTSIGIFAQGKFVHGAVLPVGGQHITLDIARGLSVSMEDAERLKVMHGSAIALAGDDRDMIVTQAIGAAPGDAPLQVPRALLSRIIAARMEEILELTRDAIVASGQAQVIGKRLIITGGASQLTGLPDLARRILGRNPRIGRPLGVAKLPETAKGPAFSSIAGLAIHPQLNSIDLNTRASRNTGLLTGTLGRFGSWFRENF
jgi:cell division protein FtsA